MSAPSQQHITQHREREPAATTAAAYALPLLEHQSEYQYQCALSQATARSGTKPAEEETVERQQLLPYIAS